jgi:hypothetical protein
MTKEQKNAISKICKDYGFENLKELKAWLKDQYGDILDEYWFSSTTEKGCYKELEKVVAFCN